MPSTRDVEVDGPEPVRAPHPIGLQARAWWGEQLVADSRSTLRVEQQGRPAELYFPLDDVRRDLFADEGRTRSAPGGGQARLWTLPGTAVPPAAGYWLVEALPAVVDGRDAARSAVGPLQQAMVAFDHDRVRVELVDPMGGADPRAVTSTRFPTLGDAAELIDELTLTQDSDRRFTGPGTPDIGRTVIDASHLLGRAVVAVGRLAPGRRLVSAYMLFVRAADTRLPVELEVEPLSSGRTFSAFGVRVLQQAKVRASGSLLLDVTAPDLIRHAEPAPEVPGPYDCPPWDMGFTGRDVRIVEGAYSPSPQAPVGPPELDAWVRYADVGDDPVTHAGLLAQFTSQLSIGAALRAHEGIGEGQAHRSLSMGINAITLTQHRDLRLDRWLLFHHRSTFAGAGMTHSQCRVHDEAGTLLASFSVEAMVRAFADPGRGRDHRTAL